jgi:hypothetical protein
MNDILSLSLSIVSWNVGNPASLQEVCKVMLSREPEPLQWPERPHKKKAQKPVLAARLFGKFKMALHLNALHDDAEAKKVCMHVPYRIDDDEVGRLRRHVSYHMILMSTGNVHSLFSMPLLISWHDHAPR